MEKQEKNFISNILYWLPTIIFNIIETCIIFLVGLALRVPIYDIICIVVVFEMTRFFIGQEKHFKSPWRCLIWTTIIFASLFLVSKVNFIIYIIMTIFTAYILSEKADINIKEKTNNENSGMYLWKRRGEASKYKFVEEYVEKNKDTREIAEFEKVLKEMNEEYYEVYKLRFYDEKSQEYIINKMKIRSTARLTERLDDIQNILKLYLKINEKQLTTKN